jgi:hypothetical protein
LGDGGGDAFGLEGSVVKGRFEALGALAYGICLFDFLKHEIGKVAVKLDCGVRVVATQLSKCFIIDFQIIREITLLVPGKHFGLQKRLILSGMQGRGEMSSPDAFLLPSDHLVVRKMHHEKVLEVLEVEFEIRNAFRFFGIGGASIPVIPFVDIVIDPDRDRGLFVFTTTFSKRGISFSRRNRLSSCK